MPRFPLFIEQMIALRDRSASLAPSFGVPNLRSLIIVTRLPGEERYLEIKPLPVINLLDTNNQEIEGLGNVTGVTRTYEVKGISRRYSREQLEHEAIDYVIDGKLKFGELIHGTLCRLIRLTEQTITWDMTLEERQGERDF